MRRLILMMGVSASGKSTFIKEHFDSEKAYVVNYDDIKESLFGENGKYKEIGEKYSYNYYKASADNREKLKEEIENIHEKARSFYGDIVVDDKHLLEVDRKKTIEEFREIVDEIDLVYCMTDLRTCLQQNQNRDGYRYVPSGLLIAEQDRIESPLYCEGFDNIWLADRRELKLKENDPVVELEL